MEENGGKIIARQPVEYVAETFGRTKSAENTSGAATHLQSTRNAVRRATNVEILPTNL